MIIIGELINSTRHEVRNAIEDRNAELIQNLALKQVEAGAHYLDVNAGAFVDDEVEHLLWLVNTVQAVTDVPLAIDSADPEAIDKALAAHKGNAMINSITDEREKFETIIPLIKKYESKVITLCMDDSGMPNTAEDRLKVVDKFFDEFEKHGIPLENVFLDSSYCVDFSLFSFVICYLALAIAVTAFPHQPLFNLNFKWYYIHRIFKNTYINLKILMSNKIESINNKYYGGAKWDGYIFY